MAIDRVGKDDILAGYDMFEHCPFYALFEDYRGKAKDLKFVFKDGGREQGRELLAQNLDVLERSGYEPVYLIRFYEETGKGDKITDVTPYCGSFRFRIKDPAGVGALSLQPVVANEGSPQFLSFLMMERDKLMRENLELKEEVRGLEREVFDLETEAAETPEDDKIGGMLGTVLKAGDEHPWVRDILKDAVYGFQKIFQRPMAAEPVHLAGVDSSPDERVNAAIEVLIKFYVTQAGGNKPEGFTNFANDMELLAKMTGNPLDFNYALSKLRENFKK